MKSIFKKAARCGYTSTVPEVGSRGRKTTCKIKTSTDYMVKFKATHGDICKSWASLN